MRATPRALTRLPAWIALAVLGWSAAAQAQETPLSVTYGPKASTGEGDPDYREVIFLSVPDSVKDRLYVRVFDPDTGGEHDLRSICKLGDGLRKVLGLRDRLLTIHRRQQWIN